MGVALSTVGGAAVGVNPGIAKEVANKVSPAGFGMRRLTESQYRQSVSDIFGSGIRVSGRFEPDPRRDGLVAIGVANVAVGAAGFEQYDAAAREIAGQVTGSAQRAALGCGPQTGFRDDPCAGQITRKYGRQLFRRPLREAEVRWYVDVAGQVAAEKRDFYAGVEAVLATMLVSPHFLFRVERAAPGAADGRLDDYSMASRLSFLIWNAPPDEALLAAADAGELRTPQGIRRQADRLLASPRFEQGMRAFFDDMLALEDLGGLQKDGAIYPRFSGRLAMDAREQTLRTIVDTLVVRNEDYRSLFTSRRTFMSRSLGLLYSEPVVSPDWEPREFSQDDPRAGILAQPAFLMAHSHPGSSSPTLRGKAIRELLMCQIVPAPPADVDFSLVLDTHNQRFPTARERLAAHNTAPTCAGCHRLMDPLGFPLEGFDGAGAPRRKENGADIDLSGSLRRANFTGALGLGAALAEDPALSSCLVSRLYSYGVGRSAESERAWVETVRARFESAGALRLRDLIQEIVVSPQFSGVRVVPNVTQANVQVETQHGS